MHLNPSVNTINCSISTQFEPSTTSETAVLQFNQSSQSSQSSQFHQFPRIPIFKQDANNENKSDTSKRSEEKKGSKRESSKAKQDKNVNQKKLNTPNTPNAFLSPPQVNKVKNEVSPICCEMRSPRMEDPEKEIRRLLDLFGDEVFSEQSVKQLYREKKINLKKHYENIKAAIKISIERDIEELERKEKQHLNFIQTRKLLKIETKGELNGEGESKTEQLPSKSIGSMSSISKVTEQEQLSALLKFTFQQSERDKNYLYEPDLYVMVDVKLSQKDDSYFSFERKKP